MTNFLTEADMDELLHSTFFIKMCDDASWLYVEDRPHEPEMNWLLSFWGGYKIVPRFQGEVLFSRLLLLPPPPSPTPLPPPPPPSAAVARLARGITVHGQACPISYDGMLFVARVLLSYPHLCTSNEFDVPE